MRSTVLLVCLSGAVSGGVAWPSQALAEPAFQLALPDAPRPPVALPRRRGVVDRIVAVVDGDPILLSGLRRRARPSVARLPAEMPAWRRANAVRGIYRALVPQLVRQRVIAHAAERAGISVDAAAIDAALAAWAKQASMTPAALIAKAREADRDAAAVRDQIRRALLEQRLFLHDRWASAAAEGPGDKALEQERKRWIDDLVARASVQVLVSF